MHTSHTTQTSNTINTSLHKFPQSYRYHTAQLILRRFYHNNHSNKNNHSSPPSTKTPTCKCNKSNHYTNLTTTQNNTKKQCPTQRTYRLRACHENIPFTVAHPPPSVQNRTTNSQSQITKLSVQYRQHIKRTMSKYHQRHAHTRTHAQAYATTTSTNQTKQTSFTRSRDRAHMD